jgi:hypothetical protein
MTRQRQRKCLGCGTLFRPDPRNVRHQRYCCQAACRQASKAASQRRWLSQPENQDYFRGAENVARVQRWRGAGIRGIGAIRAHQRPVRYKMTAACKSLK